MEALSIPVLSPTETRLWLPPEDEILAGLVDMAGWKVVIDNFSHKITRLCINATLAIEAIELIRSLLVRYGDSLCPNLKSVRFSIEAVMIEKGGRSIAPDTTAGLVLGPSVLDVTIEDRADPEEMYLVCQELARAAPRIERFAMGDEIAQDVIEEWDSEWDDMWFISVDFGLFPQLRVVHLCDISTDAWDMLGRGCPLLVEITLTECALADDWAGNDVGLPWGGDDEDRTVFPLLETLDAGCQAVHGYVLASSSMPSLTTLITSGYGDDNDGDTTIATLIAERSLNLTHLSARCGCNPLAIEAICSVGRMERLRIGFGSPECVSDETMILLSTSLPYLEVLSITTSRHDGSGCAVTSRGFLQLVERCKSLKDLEIPLDLSECDDVEKQRVTPSHSITKLTVEKAVLPDDDDAARAARFLRLWLPEVTDIGQSFGLAFSERISIRLLVEQFDSLRWL
ncbi:hypothetical protein FRB96_002501 [Tulasnella sp. 330]|nr:hypothetical protein FRB96_002501 [Tulasnella sp. 330]